METLLEVKDLQMYFISKYETVKAVDGVSFTIYEGETFGIVGESGCGKSQVCRSILRLLKKPGQIIGGKILYKGQDMVNLSESEMRKIRGKEISVIFQEPMTSLNPVLKIKKQLFEAFDETHMTKEEKLARSIELLKLVGIPSPETRIEGYTHQFSGGMRQRAMIAMALAQSPKLILADEPTTALDVTIQDQIMKLLNQLKEKLGMSIILVTHDLGVIAQMCDRVAVMYAGNIVEITDTLTLFSKPRHPYTHALMNSLPNQAKKGGKLETITGAPPNLAKLPPGCAFAPRCVHATDLCRTKFPEIVEIEQNHWSRCHHLDQTTGFEGLISVEKAKE